MSYQRQRVYVAILDALNGVGGIASRDKIKSIIAEDETSGISYEDVYDPVTSRSGNEYVPFNFDFNFGIRELAMLGYIEQFKRGADIVLTEKGRTANYTHVPSKAEQTLIAQYWHDHSKVNKGQANGD